MHRTRHPPRRAPRLLDVRHRVHRLVQRPQTSIHVLVRRPDPGRRPHLCHPRRIERCAGFFGKFVRGAGTSIVAAPLVFLNSLLFTQVVFPNYFDEIRAAQESILRSKGIPEAQIVETLKLAASMENPYLQATFGAIGTIVTGIVVSLIASAIVKKRAG
ncbi:MAG: DUF4199 domain-containing protein [Planctomycetes bacterium]|nr:DUF4199 domain-containing protein [Planctomycetota bacterium]